MSEKSDWSRTFNTWIENVKVFKTKNERRLKSFSHHRLQIHRHWLTAVVELQEERFDIKRSGELGYQHDATFMCLSLDDLDELTKFLIGLRMDMVNDSKDPRYVEAMNKECYWPDANWTFGKKPQSVKDAFERSRKVYAEGRKELPSILYEEEEP